MTRRCLAPVVRVTLHRFRAACPRVLMTSGCGCSSSWQRRTFHGVRRLVGSIRSRMNIEGGLGPCSARPVCSKSGYPSLLRPVNEHARHANCFLLFAALRQIRSIRRSLSQPVVKSLIVSLVISQLDWLCDTGRPSCMSARQTEVCLWNLVLTLRRVWSTDPGNSTTWRRCCTIFTGCEAQNESRFGWRFWRQNGLASQYLADDLHQVAAVVTATFGGDRAFSVAAARAWNSLPLSVTPSASLPVFLKHLRQFYLLAPSRHSNFSTFYIVTLFYSAVLRVFLLIVLVYSGFMYCGLAVYVLVVFTLQLLNSITNIWNPTNIYPIDKLSNIQRLSLREFLPSRNYHT